MSTKKSAAQRTNRTEAAAPAEKAESAAKPKLQAKPNVKRQIDEAVGKVRESSHENMLLGLGALAKARKQHEERWADLVAEGRRVEPKVKKAFDAFMARLQPKGMARIDFGKFKLDPKSFGRDAMRERFQQRMNDSLHKIGLPTRKELDDLSRKVDKLAELQQA